MLNFARIMYIPFRPFLIIGLEFSIFNFQIDASAQNIPVSPAAGLTVKTGPGGEAGHVLHNCVQSCVEAPTEVSLGHLVLLGKLSQGDAGVVNIHSLLARLVSNVGRYSEWRVQYPEKVVMVTFSSYVFLNP